MQIRNVEKKIISEKKKQIARQLKKQGFTPGQIAQIVKLERTYIWRITKS